MGGLLSDGNHRDDVNAIRLVVNDVLENWDKYILGHEGLTLKVGQTSLSRIGHIGEELFSGKSLPNQPGPFKRAAAVAVLLRMFGEFSWQPKHGAERLSLREELYFRTRFALATVPVTLHLVTATLDGTSVKLNKLWLPATLHLQVEMLNWLRWLEKPMVGETAIDLSRLHRTVLAFSMVVEQSYYLVDSQTSCDVMHRAQTCIEEAKKDDQGWRDLCLFYPADRILPED